MPGSKGPFKDARVQRSKCSRVKASKGPNVRGHAYGEHRVSIEKDSIDFWCEKV
jgi:hypothetical protein